MKIQKNSAILSFVLITWGISAIFLPCSPVNFQDATMKSMEPYENLFINMVETSFGDLRSKDPANLTSRTAYALLVGVADYPGTVDDLRYCASDAILMRSLLINRYNFNSTNIIMLRNAEATKSAIMNAFNQIDAIIDADDIFLFYYSGHGGEGGGAYHFICPYDYFPTNYFYDIELDIFLDRVACSQQYVLIDACNSGGFIPEVQAPNRFIMTACTATQLSWETTGLHHGVFTYFFQASIYGASDSNGDNVLSMEEQFAHLSPGTINYMLGYGELQQPTKYDGISGQAVLFPSIGKLTFIFDDNFLNYSFYVYGHGSLVTLNLTVCAISQGYVVVTEDLTDYAPTSSGFGYYSGSVDLGSGNNASGYEFIAQIDGLNLKTFSESFGDSDGDGLNDLFEIYHTNGTNPALNDTDFDGLNDYTEFYGSTNATNSDSDNDGIPDGYEVNNGLNPLVNDSALDLDSDGLDNIFEYTLGTMANNEDTDGDLMPDGYEFSHGLNYFQNDADSDLDNDTLSNLLEYQLNSNPNHTDTDGDTLPDAYEYNCSLNLLEDDRDSDLDSDGLTNLLEYQIGSRPDLSDTDSDQMPDLWEYDNTLDFNFNDTAMDPDNDTLTNLEEYQYNTNPHLADTDGDTWDDNLEIDRGTDPLDPDDFPRPENAVPGFNLYTIIVIIGITTIILIKRYRK